MLYVIIILAANALIILSNAAARGSFGADTIFPLALSSFGGTAAMIALDGIEAFLIRKLPERWFSADKTLFRISEKERKTYQSLGIKKWKDKVPELGGFTGFHKNKLQSTTDGKYLGRFITEAQYGVVIHEANSIFGFLTAFIPVCSAPSVWIPVYAVNFVLNALPAMILRYNLPVLRRLYKRAERNEKKDA